MDINEQIYAVPLVSHPIIYLSTPPNTPSNSPSPLPPPPLYLPPPLLYPPQAWTSMNKCPRFVRTSACARNTTSCTPTSPWRNIFNCSLLSKVTTTPLAISFPTSPRFNFTPFQSFSYPLSDYTSFPTYAECITLLIPTQLYTLSPSPPPPSLPLSPLLLAKVSLPRTRKLNLSLPNAPSYIPSTTHHHTSSDTSPLSPSPCQGVPAKDLEHSHCPTPSNPPSPTNPTLTPPL